MPSSIRCSVRYSKRGALLALALLLAGCGGGARAGGGDPAASAPSQPPVRTVAAVTLGTSQQVLVASSFGPGTGDVTAAVTVFAVRDQIVPDAALRPAAAISHWAAADVQVCRDRSVVLGYPAWVLGDDQGRTAAVTKVLHPEFPQPALPNGPDSTGCQRGWVVFVTPDDLHPTKVTFEQTREIPGAWRIAG